MEKIYVSGEMLRMLDCGKRRPGVINIGGHYIKWEFLYDIAYDQKSQLKLILFQQELLNKEYGNWMDIIIDKIDKKPIRWEIM